MARIMQCEDGIEPVSDSWGEVVGNVAQYNVVSGNAITYSASDMVVTVGAGVQTFNYAAAATASDTGTLVSDPSNPRWAWVARASDGNVEIVSGDPAATPSVPELGDRVPYALCLVQAGQTIADNIVTKLDLRAPWKSMTLANNATQSIGDPTTTYDDINVSGGTMSFYAEANGVYAGDYYLPLTFGGTGGAKFQFTGPAAPTAVTITGDYGRGSSAVTGVFNAMFTPVAAFSTDINSLASAAGGTSDTAYVNNAPGSFIRIRLLLRNGSTAGVVTLQGAQNNANSTTTVGLGATMTVERIG